MVTARPPPRVKKAQALDSSSESGWDGWPDGTFEREFTFEEVDAYNNLQVHWATKSHGVQGGIDFAEEWMDGKRLQRHCLGIIQCDNPDCTMTIRPQTTPKGIDRQLREACKCGAVLNHIQCLVRSALWTYSKGVHFTNTGDHNHARPGYILHISKTDQVRFKTLVNTNPTTGLLALIVGVSGINGPGESVADISDVFLNAGVLERHKTSSRRNLILVEIHSFPHSQNSPQHTLTL